MRRSSLVSFLIALVVALLAAACSPSAEELMAKGKAAYDRGKYDEALEYYNQVLEEKPGNPSVLSAIGEVYLKQGDADKVIEHFEKAVSDASDEAERKTFRAQLAEGYLMKATEQWRKGEYRADPGKEIEIEQLAQKATVEKNSPTAQKGFALLIALYDYQFERHRAATDEASDPAQKSELIKKELAHIEKVRSTVRPPEELKKRMRSRVEELTREAFFAEADRRFAEEVKPLLTAIPTVTMTADRIAVVSTIPLTPKAIEDGLNTPAIDPALKATMMEPYYAQAKEWTVDEMEAVVAGMLGTGKLDKSIRTDRVETFTVDAEVFVEEVLTPETPDVKTPVVKITGSMALSELRDMAFQYHLDRSTEDKSQPTAKADGAAAPADAATAPADGATAPADGATAPADGAAAPTDGAPAPEAPADGAPAPEAPAPDAPADGGGAAPTPP